MRSLKSIDNMMLFLLMLINEYSQSALAQNIITGNEKNSLNTSINLQEMNKVDKL